MLALREHPRPLEAPRLSCRCPLAVETTTKPGPRDHPSARPALKRQRELALATLADAPSNKKACTLAPLHSLSVSEDDVLAEAALEHLQTLLRSVPADQRRATLERTALPVRSALLTFMTRARVPTTGTLPQGWKVAAANVPRPSMAGDANVRTLRNAHGLAYQAQLRIGHLRAYARAQPELNAAMKHLEVLACLRRGVVEAGEDIWEQPAQFCQVLEEVLSEHRTSQEALGLGFFVYMRADEWIDRRRAITSPVLRLREALELHRRLLRARRRGWASLRAEWVPLLRCTRHARKQGISLADAEALAEAARRGRAERQLRRAVLSVQRALACGRAAAARQHTAARRLAARTAADVATKDQRLAKQRRQLLQARWRWLRRTDLTMAEMLRGPPRHLQL